jgi:hypothetical protein
MTMPDEPTGLVKGFWRASLTILGASLALWLSVRILLQIWVVLAVAGGVILAIWLLLRWWYFRS